MKVERLVGKQQRSVQLSRDHHLNLWEGSVRSSKTISSLIRWAEYVRTGPAGNLAMIGKTERTLKRNVIDVLVEIFGEKRCKHNRGEGELQFLGRRIYLAGANDARSEDKIRGLTLAGFYGDEISVWPEGFWSMLLTRLSVDGAQGFGTTNPDNPNHWLMRDYLKKAAVHLRHDGTVHRSDDPAALDLVRMSFNLRDNPSLSATYIGNLEREFTGLWRKRFIDGLWVLAEGSIYDNFDPDSEQVVDELPEMVTWVVAVDYGTTNPFVALLIGVGVDDRLYVAREWRWDSKHQRRQMTDAEYSAALRRWLDDLDPASNAVPAECPGARHPGRIYVDPSAASFIAQLYRDGWTGVHGADNAVVDGIRSVASLLAVGRLRVHRSCAGLIDEKTGYVWDPKAAERGVEQPLKVADHGPDAERYGVAGTRNHWRHWLQIDVGQAG